MTSVKSILRAHGRRVRSVAAARRARFLLAMAAAIAIALAVLPAVAPAEAGCDRFASPVGSDADPGTEVAPVRSVARLIEITGAGEEGCLPSGSRFVEPIGSFIVDEAGGSPGSPARIRTDDPSGAAAIVEGAMWLQGGVHDLELERIRFTGSPGNGDRGTMLVVDGDRVVFRETEMTWRRGTCLNAGHRDGYTAGDPAGTVAAEGLVIERSRIHDCGNDPEIVESLRDPGQSGVHGLYLIDAPGARIHDNYVYDNVSRGIQLWPDVDGATVDHNVFDGNGSNVNVGSSAAYGHFSEGNRFQDNVIDDAVLRSAHDPPWGPGDTESIVGFFPADGDTRGNAFEGNCVHQANPAEIYGGNGYTHSGDVVADPQFFDRAAGDFRLAAGSPCTGKGPRVDVVGAEPGTVPASPLEPPVARTPAGSSGPSTAFPPQLRLRFRRRPTVDGGSIRIALTCDAPARGWVVVGWLERGLRRSRHRSLELRPGLNEVRIRVRRTEGATRPYTVEVVAVDSSGRRTRIRSHAAAP